MAIKEMELTEKEREVVNNIHRIITSSIDIRDTYSGIVAELKKVIDFDRISISLLKEGNKVANTYVMSSSYSSLTLQENKPYPLEGSMLEQIAATGEAVIVDDTKKGQFVTDSLLIQEGMRSRLGYPLKIRGRVIGGINLSSKEPNNFGPLHCVLLEQIAPSLAMATENTLLFQKIKESEKLYKDLYDNAPDMYCSYSRDGTIVECNQTAARVLGYPRESLLGSSIYDFVHEESKKHLQESIASGRAEGLELKLIKGGGEIIDVSINAAPDHDAAGNVIGIRVVMRDITEKKQAEEQGRQEKEKFQSAVDALGLGLCLMDRSLCVLWSNENLSRVWGLPQNPEGRCCPEILHCEEVTHPAQKAFEAGDGLFRDVKVITLEGRRKYIENIALPLKNAVGKVERVLLLSRDITQRQKTIHQLSLLRQLGESLQHILRQDRLLQLVLTCVTAGHALGFNRAMLFLVNEERGTVYGRMAIGPSNKEEALRIWQEVSTKYRSLEDLLKDTVERGPLDTPLNITTKLLAYPLSKEDEIIVRCIKEKKPIVVKDCSTDPRVCKEFYSIFGSKEFVCVPLIVKGRAIGAILADNLYSGEPITEDHVQLLSMFAGQAALAIENAETYKNLEDKIRQLTEAQEKLLRSERLIAMGEMAAYIAHEIRNPLVTIGGFARSIERSRIKDENTITSSKIIMEEVKRLEKILDNIKDFSKPAEPKKTRMHINLLMEDTLSLIEGYLKERRIGLIKVMSPSLPIAHIDPAQMKQVFLNLIKNAVESMPGGGTLTVKTSLEDKSIKVDFTDTGEGIPPEVMAKIFTPFFTTKASGTGVGLAVCQKIIDDHDGKLRVSSAPGKGSTFSILLPALELERRAP